MIDTCTKYVRITVEKGDGTILVDEKPGDEPLFVLRGHDALAGKALEAYRNALEWAQVDPAFVAHIEEHMAEFQRWPMSGRWPKTRGGGGHKHASGFRDPLP